MMNEPLAFHHIRLSFRPSVFLNGLWFHFKLWGISEWQAYCWTGWISIF